MFDINNPTKTQERIGITLAVVAGLLLAIAIGISFTIAFLQPAPILAY